MGPVLPGGRLCRQGVDLEGFDNDSLGGISAELMRRVSHDAAARGLNDDEYHVLKSKLAKNILVQRRRSEPAIVLPSNAATGPTARLGCCIDEVATFDPQIEGDLEELMPRWPVHEGH